MLSAVSFYTLLFLALIFVPATTILVVLFFLDHEQRLWQRGIRAIGRFGENIEQWPISVVLRKRFPLIFSFLGRRLDPHSAWGLSATVAGLFMVLGLGFLLAVLQGIVAKAPFVSLDIRLHNAVPLFRTTGMTWFMFMLTTLGSATVLSLLCLGVALHALARDRPRLAAIFVLGLAGTGLISATLKALIGRARPLDAIVGLNEASFPSGHLLSGAVVYGLLASLLLGSRARPGVRAVGITLLLLVIVGIGISRVYVGAHWPSDLLGSLALALIVLASLLFFLHYGQPVRWIDTFRLRLDAAAVRIAGSSAIVIALGAAAILASQVEVIPMIGPPPPSHLLEMRTLRLSLPSGLPRGSEGLLGSQMEPISLVIIGNEADLLGAFALVGWTRADLPTPLRVGQEAVAAVRNLPDPSGPVTPAFFADWPQNLALGKPDTGSPTIRRRHHVRLWQTVYCLAPACRPVWVATASYDAGIRLLPHGDLPTHLIDPAIDDERALVVTDLTRAGATQAGSSSVVPSQRAKHAARDPFWTDGRAVVLVLP